MLLELVGAEDKKSGLRSSLSRAREKSAIRILELVDNVSYDGLRAYGDYEREEHA
jgi:hypothetical protein